MSIVFMGTPEWAIPSLKAVIESGIEVSAGFTQPDRRVGRKKRLLPRRLNSLHWNKPGSTCSRKCRKQGYAGACACDVSGTDFSLRLRANSNSAVFRHSRYRLFQSAFFFFTKSSWSIASADRNCFRTENNRCVPAKDCFASRFRSIGSLFRRD